jgi:hypothetical protein
MGAAVMGGLTFGIQFGLSVYNEVRKMKANQDVADAEHDVAGANGLVRAQEKLL